MAVQHQLNNRTLLNSKNNGSPAAKTKGRAITYVSNAPTTSGGNLQGPTSGIKTLGNSGAMKNAEVTAAF
jgi:hypothetical protein